MTGAGDFTSRAAALFGGLPAPTDDPAPWTVSQHQVVRSGKTDYSSEEEEERCAREAAEERKEILPPAFLNLSGGEGHGDDFTPSAAFCQALDREDEFDVNDAVAAGTEVAERQETLRKVAAKRRARNGGESNRLLDMLDAEDPGDTMELDMNHRFLPDAAAGPSSHFLPSHHPATTAGRPPRRREQPHQQNGHAGSSSHQAGSSSEAGSSRQHAEEASRAKMNGNLDGDGESTARFLAQAEQARQRHLRAALQRQDDSRRDAAGEGGDAIADNGLGVVARPVAKPSRKGYVPDHVRNPAKYTCYTLDEPIEVGSGRTSERDSSAAELLEAVQAARAQAQANRTTASRPSGGAEEPLGAAPEGDGSEGPLAKPEFRPRAKPVQPGGAPSLHPLGGPSTGDDAARKINDRETWALLAATALDDEADDTQLEEGGEKESADPEVLKTHAPKRRQFRGKSKAEDMAE